MYIAGICVECYGVVGEVMDIRIETVCSGHGEYHSNLIFSGGSSQFCVPDITHDQMVDIIQKLDAIQLENFGDIPGRNKRLLSWYFLSFDKRCIQKVLRDVKKQELAVALKNVAEVVRKKVFDNMSKRAVQMLKEDMEYMGPVRIRDVEKAHENILLLIRHLEDTGEIEVLPGAGMI